MMTTKTSHTPGRPGEEYDVCEVKSADGYPPGEHGAANAALIAAAPDLLAACKLAEVWLANCLPIGTPSDTAPLPVIRAAIARAEARP